MNPGCLSVIHFARDWTVDWSIVVMRCSRVRMDG